MPLQRQTIPFPRRFSHKRRKHDLVITALHSIPFVQQAVIIDGLIPAYEEQARIELVRVPPIAQLLVRVRREEVEMLCSCKQGWDELAWLYDDEVGVNERKRVERRRRVDQKVAQEEKLGAETALVGFRMGA